VVQPVFGPVSPVQLHDAHDRGGCNVTATTLMRANDGWKAHSGDTGAGLCGLGCHSDLSGMYETVRPRARGRCLTLVWRDTRITYFFYKRPWCMSKHLQLCLPEPSEAAAYDQGLTAWMWWQRIGTCAVRTASEYQQCMVPRLWWCVRVCV